MSAAPGSKVKIEELGRSKQKKTVDPTHPCSNKKQIVQDAISSLKKIKNKGEQDLGYMPHQPLTSELLKKYYPSETVDHFYNQISIQGFFKDTCGNKCYGFSPSFQPNKFVGRKEELAFIDKHFEKENLFSVQKQQSAISSSVCAITQTVRGLGGVGKTQLANFWYTHTEQTYPFKLWFDATSYEMLKLQWVGLAHCLGIDITKQSLETGGVKTLIRSIYGKLCIETGPILMVLDNAPDYEAIKEYLPILQEPKLDLDIHTLVTSRVGEWGEDILTLSLNSFSTEDTIDFVKQRLPNITISSLEVQQIEKLLGNFPLALTQMVAYIKRMKWKQDGLKRYLEYFSKINRQRNLLLFKPPIDDPHQKTIYITWLMVAKKLCELSPNTMKLLQLFAYIGENNIPRSLCEAYLSNKNTDETLVLLDDYSLLTFENNYISTHQLVQTVIRCAQQDDSNIPGIGIIKNLFYKHNVLSDIITFVSEQFVFNPYEPDTWKKCEDLLPHVFVVLEHAALAKLNKQFHKLAQIHYNMAQLSNFKGQLTKAESDIQKAIQCYKLCEKTAFNSEQADCYSVWSAILFNMSNHEKAINQAKSALTLVEGDNNEGSLKSKLRAFIRLVKEYNHLGDYVTAEDFCLQVERLAKIFNPNSSNIPEEEGIWGDVLEASNLNIKSMSEQIYLWIDAQEACGELYRLKNFSSDKALTFFKPLRDFLAKHQQSLPRQYIRVLQTIATIEIENQNHVEAEKCLAEAKTMLDKLKQLNPSTPDIDVYNMQDGFGQYWFAVENYLQARTIYENLLDLVNKKSSEMPQVKSLIFFYLSRIAQEQKRYAEAESYSRQSLEIIKPYWEKTPSREIAIRLKDIGDICNAQGKLKQAHEFYKKALQELNAILGAKKTRQYVLLLECLGWFYFKLDPKNNGQTAEQYFLKAVKIVEQYCKEDKNHPWIIFRYRNLGVFYRIHERYDEAEIYLQKTEKSAQAYYHNKPDSSRISLLKEQALLATAKKEYYKAEKCFKQALSMNEGLYPNEAHLEKVAILMCLGDLFKERYKDIEKNIERDQAAFYFRQVVMYYQEAFVMVCTLYPNEPYSSVFQIFEKHKNFLVDCAEYDRAEACFENMVMFLQKIHNSEPHHDSLKVHLEFSKFYKARERFDAMGVQFDKSLSICNKLKFDINTSYVESKQFEGLQFKKILGDGHCFFRAVASYTGQDVMEMRRIVATHMADNLHSFQEFYAGSEEEFRVHIEAIRSTNEFADAIEISVLQKLLDRPIIILMADGSASISDDIEQFTGEPIFVHYNKQDHYDALTLKPNADGREILARIQENLNKTSVAYVHQNMRFNESLQSDTLTKDSLEILSSFVFYGVSDLKRYDCIAQIANKLKTIYHSAKTHRKVLINSIACIGHAYIELKNYQEALFIFELLVDYYENLSQAELDSFKLTRERYYLAVCLMNQSEPARAISLLNQCLSFFEAEELMISDDGFENAKHCLRSFGKELGLDELTFDENKTCILGIDNTYSMHLTYEPNFKRLYVYSPLLHELPSDTTQKLVLYEALLQGAILGHDMTGGGVGVAVNESLILMHSTIDMKYAAPSVLRSFAPPYLESVEKWRALCANLSTIKNYTSYYAKFYEKISKLMRQDKKFSLRELASEVINEYKEKAALISLNAFNKTTVLNMLETLNQTSHSIMNLDPMRNDETLMQNKSVYSNRGYIRHGFASNEDSGFAAMWVTREKALEQLLTQVSEVGFLVRPVVEECLFTREVVDYLKREGVLSSHITLKQIIRNLSYYSADMSVIKACLQYDVGEKKLNSGAIHPALLQALAHTQGIELRLWHLGEKQQLLPHTGLNYDYSIYRPSPPCNPLHRSDLLCVNRCSYDRLSIIDTTNERTGEPFSPIHLFGFDCAKINLEEFGKSVKLEGLKFDENNTCHLRIDDKISMCLTYEPNNNRLFIYSSLLEDNSIPKDNALRLALYEALLGKAMLGGGLAGGGVGLVVKEGLILMHSFIDVTSPSALSVFAPFFVEAVEAWRKDIQELLTTRQIVSQAHNDPSHSDNSMTDNFSAIDFYNQGQKHEKLERFAEALTAYNFASALDPNEPFFYHYQAKCHLKLGCIEEAITNNEMALALNPTKSGFYSFQANCLRKLERYEESLEMVNCALELNPNKAEYHHARAFSLFALERYEEAIHACDLALDFKNHLGRAHHYQLKADCLCELGRKEDALTAINEALKLKPELSFSHHIRGSILNKLNRYREALQVLDRALELNSKNPYAYYYRGQTFCALGLHKDALQDYNSLLAA